MPSVMPTKADLVFDGMGLNIHLEDFGRSYDLNYLGPNGVQSLLALRPVRWVRGGIAAPSGDSATHKSTYYFRAGSVGQQTPFSLPMPMSYPLSNLDTDFITNWNMIPFGSAIENQWSALEGPNEPTASQAPQVRAFQQALYNAVKSDTTLQNPGVGGIPAVQVLGSGLTAPTTSWKAFGDLTGMCDVGNIHPYYSGGPETFLQSYFNAARGGPYATGSIDGTETGWTWSMQQASPPPVPTDIITRYLPRLWVHGIAEVGYRRLYYYQMMANRAPNPTDPEAGYGLINNDGSLTTMWKALLNMQGTNPYGFIGFNDAQNFTPTALNYSVTGGGSGLHNVLLQKKNGRYMICLWIGGNSWDPTQQAYTNIAAQTVTVNLAGRGLTSYSQTVFNDDGTLTVTILISDGSGNITATVTDKMMVLDFT